MIAIIMIISVGALAASWVNETQKRPTIDIGKGEQIGAKVEGLSPDELQQVADVSVLNPGGDMDWAYAKAVALSQLDKHKEALEVYEAISRSGKAPYYIYVDYALTAVRSGDVQRGITVMTEAIAKLESDTSVDARIKTDTKVRLESKLAGFKEDAGQ